MITKQMEKILAYAEGVEKKHTQTHRRLLYKTPVSGLHLQTKDNHGVRDREEEKRPSMYTNKTV